MVHKTGGVLLLWCDDEEVLMMMMELRSAVCVVRRSESINSTSFSYLLLFSSSFIFLFLGVGDLGSVECRIEARDWVEDGF